MKWISILTLFLSILFSNQLMSALNHAYKADAYSHLREVNQQWDVYHGAIPGQTMSFNNDKERIRFHLLSVIEILKEKTTEGLNKEQTVNRINLLNELSAYALQMNFPTNEVYSHRQPCFIDAYNNFCAVGHMMKVSGFENVAREIQSQQNYSFLADIRHEAIPGWAVEHGFDLQELAWIQPGYPPVNNYQTIGTGTNGDVKDFYTLEDRVFFIGDFTELDGEPCNGVGVYQNGSAECVLNGLQGTLNDVHVTYNGAVWVAGALQHNGVDYPLACFENGAWNYFNIGNNSNAIGKELTFFGLNIESVIMQVGQEYQMWMRQNAQGWFHKLTFNGPVNTSTMALGQTFFGGRFTEVTIHFPSSNTQTLTANNLISVDYLFSQLYPESWTGYTSEVPSEINTLLGIGNTLYIGGKANNTNSALLTRYQNNAFHTMLDRPTEGTENYSINDMIMMDGSGLLLGGDLPYALMNAPSMTYGKHLYHYEVVLGYVSPVADFDAPVNSLASINGHTILGGQFVQNVGVSVKHLAISMTTSSVDEMENITQFSLFPNPASGNVQLNFTEQQSGTLRISDLAGRVLQEQQIKHQKNMSLDVSRWPSQVVLVSVVGADEKNLSTQRLIIQ